MARTIQEIKNEMTSAFMADETLASKYGFAPKSSFEETFSIVSIESIFFFIIATCMWTLETLFDSHKKEIADLIESKKPHRLKWYRNKALAFQYGRALDEDADTYAEVVESEKVVKYASAVEYQGRLYIKVAKGGAVKEPLSLGEQGALIAYFSDIKDAGVVLEVVNKPADHFALDMDVYYDPMVFNAQGLRLDTGADTVRDTIKNYLQNGIPFNGEYRNVSLVDVLQQLYGVVIPELKIARTVSESDFQSAKGGSVAWKTIQAKHLPESGYYKIYNDSDLVLKFIAYQSIETV